MTKLIMKGSLLVWTVECEEESFHTPKGKLVNAPILVLSEIGNRFTVYTYVSSMVLGCLLKLKLG